MVGVAVYVAGVSPPEVGVATIETEVTPADAMASITQPLAFSNVAPFAGMITSVLGGGLFTLMVTGALSRSLRWS